MPVSRVFALLLLSSSTGCLSIFTKLDGPGTKCRTPFFRYNLLAEDGSLLVEGLDPSAAPPVLIVTTLRVDNGVVETDTAHLIPDEAAGSFTFDEVCPRPEGREAPCAFIYGPDPERPLCASYDADLEFELVTGAGWPTELQDWPPVQFEYRGGYSDEETLACLWNDWCVRVDL
jgi:hypothetical protein